MRVAALVLIAASSQAVAAQAPNRGPVLLGVSTSARAQGLGGGIPTTLGDSDAAFVSPALASMARGFSLGWQSFGGEGRLLTLSTARPWFGGGVFAGLRTLDWSGSGGPGGHPGELDPLASPDGPGATEAALTVGYGRDLLGLRVGATGHVLSQRWGEDASTSVAVDLGLAHRMGPGWVHGAIRGLGEAADLAGARVDPPLEAALGWGAYGRPVGPLDLGLAADVTYRDDGTWLAGGGIEFGYWPVEGRTFMVRIGARSVPAGEASPFRFGGSFLGDELVIDYAFQPIDGADGIHRVTVGWR